MYVCVVVCVRASRGCPESFSRSRTAASLRSRIRAKRGAYIAAMLNRQASTSDGADSTTADAEAKAIFDLERDARVTGLKYVPQIPLAVPVDSSSSEWRVFTFRACVCRLRGRIPPTMSNEQSKVQLDALELASAAERERAQNATVRAAVTTLCCSNVVPVSNRAS